MLTKPEEGWSLLRMRGAQTQTQACHPPTEALRGTAWQLLEVGEGYENTGYTRICFQTLLCVINLNVVQSEKEERGSALVGGSRRNSRRISRSQVGLLDTMHHAPCTMHHAPCTMHHAPCTKN